MVLRPMRMAMSMPVERRLRSEMAMRTSIRVRPARE
jgi:hypothetical protein